MNAYVYLWFLFLLGVSFQVKAYDEWQSVEKFKRFVQDCRQTLDGAQMNDLAQLREFISRSNDGYNIKIPTSPLSTFAIDNGIRYLITNRQEHFEHSRNGRKQYEAKFDKHVKGTCDVLSMKLQPIFDDYRYLMNNLNAVKHLDVDSLEWLANTRICFEILRDPVGFRKRGYNMMIGEHFHRFTIGKVFHKIAKHL